MQRSFFVVFLWMTACLGLCEACDNFSSEEDPELPVAQIEDNGLITTYQYDPFTKQCTAALQGNQEGLVSRCFYFYNAQGFLEQIICDDGQGQTSDDLIGVTHRQMIDLHACAPYDPSNDMYEFVPIDEFWDTIVNSFFSGFHHLQVSAHQARMKWGAELKLPLPVGKALEKIGKTLLGESTYLLMGPHFEETHADCYGQHEINDKVRITFINGILNTRTMMLDSLDLISESHGGNKIHYVFRPTEGWTWDISRAVAIRTAFTVGFRSLHAHLLAQIWRELIQEMGGIEGGGVIMHYAHSLGGSDTDRARELLSPEEQKMIRVVTFGSSTLIRNVGFQSVINMISVNDGVSSSLLEPLGHFRNYFDPDTNVRFHGSFLGSPIWPTDHLLNGPTYGVILRKLGTKFVAEFSPRVE